MVTYAIPEEALLKNLVGWGGEISIFIYLNVICLYIPVVTVYYSFMYWYVKFERQNILMWE